MMQVAQAGGAGGDWTPAFTWPCGVRPVTGPILPISVPLYYLLRATLWLSGVLGLL